MTLGRARPAAAVAQERVPFDTALRWVGIDVGTRSRGMKTACPLCGADGAFRVYPDHGWCFAEQKYLSTVGLLAAKWELSREDAALAALEKIGYVLADLAHLWAGAQRRPEPAREDLADALRVWCEARCPDWKARQFESGVAGALARCLGLLPRVRTEDDCELWLRSCKQVMSRVLEPGLAK
jgi:hypothetical protein